MFKKMKENKKKGHPKKAAKDKGERPQKRT